MYNLKYFKEIIKNTNNNNKKNVTLNVNYFPRPWKCKSEKYYIRLKRKFYNLLQYLNLFLHWILKTCVFMWHNFRQLRCLLMSMHTIYVQPFFMLRGQQRMYACTKCVHPCSWEMECTLKGLQVQLCTRWSEEKKDVYPGLKTVLTCNMLMLVDNE